MQGAAKPVSHSYNGLDDRVSTDDGTGTRHFVYAPDGRVLGEYGTSASDVKAEFIWMSPEVGDSGTFGGDDGLGGYMPLAVATPDPVSGGSQLLWVHGNHMGVPTVFTNASGTQFTFPTGYSLPGFPGQSRTFADLYYNRYRDYDPTTGRYIQADPIGLAGGSNPYSYALNSPLRYSDPKGLFIDTLADAAFIIYGIYRIGADNVFGDNCPGTLRDNVTALTFDVAGLFIPGVTGLGAASRAARNADDVFPIIKPGSRGGDTADQRFSDRVKKQTKDADPTSTCVYCARPGTGTYVDHSASRATGGNATPENAQLACPHCNSSKGAGNYPKSPPPEYEGPWPPLHWPK